MRDWNYRHRQKCKGGKYRTGNVGLEYAGTTVIVPRNDQRQDGFLLHYIKTSINQLNQLQTSDIVWLTADKQLTDRLTKSARHRGQPHTQHQTRGVNNKTVLGLRPPYRIQLLVSSVAKFASQHLVTTAWLQFGAGISVSANLVPKKKFLLRVAVVRYAICRSRCNFDFSETVAVK